MSAWRVSKAHIDVLVGALIEVGIVEPGTDPNKLGKMLWRENFKSVNARYGEVRRTPKYEYLIVARVVYKDRDGREWRFDDPWLILKQARCYGYQSCEHDGWPSSKAHALILALEEKLKANGFHPETGPYDAAPWGVA